MKRALIVLAAVALRGLLAAQSKTLDIYVLDVEGGNATLFVTPSREIGADRHRQWRTGGCTRRGSHHGRREGRGPRAD